MISILYISFITKVDFENINEIIGFLLKNYLEKNKNKIGIIFYDSSLISFDINLYDSCYFFDLNVKKKLTEYNVIIEDEVKEFKDKYKSKGRCSLLWKIL